MVHILIWAAFAVRLYAAILYGLDDGLSTIDFGAYRLSLLCEVEAI